MIDKVKDYIRKNNLFPDKSKLIVGVSGGADSVVLLYVLKRLGYKCLAAHCNFHLRGEESNRDEKLVVQLTDEWNILLLKKDFNTSQIAEERGISIEMAARDLRYEWFEQLRQERGADAICVAHHREDNVETVLLNLIRGTGIRGLSGIKPKNGFIARPLLDISKKEILHFIEENDIPFITDSSNLQEEYVRNKIRLQVLPLLKTINPSVNESILQTIENLNEAEKVYTDAIEKVIQAVFNEQEKTIDIKLLRELPSPESVLFELLKPYGFGTDIIRTIYKAMDAQSGKVFYSSDYCVVKDRDKFIISDSHKNNHCIYVIRKEDTFLEKPFKLSLLFCEKKDDFLVDKSKNTACLDADKLQFPLFLRRWKAGDKFIPFGMNGYQKLSDYFNNNKFSKIQKENTWLLVSGNDIVWIINHRIDDRFKVNKSTRNLYILKVL